MTADQRSAEIEATTTVEIREVEKLLARIAEINVPPLENIEWTLDGVKVNVSDEWIADWKFMGMANTTFIEVRGYCDGPIVRFQAMPSPADEQARKTR